MLSAYGWDSVVLNKTNRALFAEIACHVAALIGPWLLGADFNFTVEELTDSGFLELTRSAVVTDGSPTCNGRVIDYFVVSRSLLPCVVGLKRLEDAWFEPHHGVRLFL